MAAQVFFLPCRENLLYNANSYWSILECSAPLTTVMEYLEGGLKSDVEHV